MKKIVFSLVFMLFAVASFAQQNGATLWSELTSSGTVSAKFTLKGMNAEGRQVITESGTAYMQGESYKIESESTDIWCDGSSMWVLSKDIDELVISENETMPFMKAANVKKDQKGNITATYTADDIKFQVYITSVKHLDKKFAASYFKCNVDALSDDVIVTDLR